MDAEMAATEADARDAMMQVHPEELIGLISSEIYPMPNDGLANLQLL